MRLILLLLLLCSITTHSMQRIEQLKNVYSALENKLLESIPDRLSLLEKKEILNLTLGFASLAFHLYSSYEIDTASFTLKQTSFPIACITCIPPVLTAINSVRLFYAIDQEEREEIDERRVRIRKNTPLITR